MNDQSGLLDEATEILIVEDSPIEAQLLQSTLLRAGYRITVAQNGILGLNVLKQHPHALVMSDVMMPEMNGYQLCREIKHDEVLKSIPVILLTSLSEPEDIIEAIKSGADSYLTKPIIKDVLLEHVRALLNTPITSMRTDEPGQVIDYNGKCHLIMADNQQILNLLFSVYRNTVAQNRQLMNTREQLNRLNNSLDQIVQERTAALQKSEMRIRTILNTALDAFVGMDQTGRVTEWNAEAERLFGYPRDQVIGKSLAGLIIPPAYREAHQRGLSVFMETGMGLVIGGHIEVTAMHREGGEFPVELSITVMRQEEETFFSAFIRDITERKQVESKVRFLAYHDQLTELPNRELFYDRLSQAVSQARRKHSRLVLLFLDLDGFKAVNDGYGHEAGDMVLKAVARRLQACVRGVDTVARLGGDEFIVILNEIESLTDVVNIAEKIIQRLTEPVLLMGERKCGVGVSIGIAGYPEDGYELDKLISAADSAMYKSKACSKSAYTFFKQHSDDHLEEHPWVIINSAQLLNVPEIDQQHQELADRINRLNDAVKRSIPMEEAVALYDEMISYARIHFEDEERIMQQIGYDGEEAHRLCHQRLIGEATYLRGKFIQGDELLVLQFLKDWLFSHITDMDKLLAIHINNANLPSLYQASLPPAIFRPPDDNEESCK